MTKDKATLHVGVIITLYNNKEQILLAKRALFKTRTANAGKIFQAVLSKVSSQ